MGRRLGQHFLRDPRILDRIVDALDPGSDDVVVEIGPGEGTLTRRLLPRVGRVVAIERDAALADRLPSSLEDAEHGSRLRVIAADALSVDWHREAEGESPRGPIKVVGNVPYYITSPLIEHALQAPLPVVVVFLIQREVADRVAAQPGTRAFGALSVGVQLVARAERLFVVRAGAFQPPPKVDSAVVRLTPLPEPLASPGERAALRAFTVAVFGRRRQQLARSLRDLRNLTADQAAAACAEAGVNGAARPETLTPAQFVQLFRAATSPA
jgi:16S rRNA (adenine1518-N6/adenine1519-N6)-dimethyltransferase